MRNETPQTFEAIDSRHLRYLQYKADRKLANRRSERIMLFIAGIVSAMIFQNIIG